MKAVDIESVTQVDVVFFLESVRLMHQGNEAQKRENAKIVPKEAVRLLTSPEDPVGVIGDELAKLYNRGMVENRFLALAAYRILMVSKVLDKRILHDRIHFDKEGPIMEIIPCPNPRPRVHI